MIALSTRLNAILAAAREARVGRELTTTEQRELAEGLAAHLELAAAWGTDACELHAAARDSEILWAEAADSACRALRIRVAELEARVRNMSAAAAEPHWGGEYEVDEPAQGDEPAP